MFLGTVLDAVTLLGDVDARSVPARVLVALETRCRAKTVKRHVTGGASSSLQKGFTSMTNISYPFASTLLLRKCLSKNKSITTEYGTYCSFLVRRCHPHSPARRHSSASWRDTCRRCTGTRAPYNCSSAHLRTVPLQRKIHFSTSKLTRAELIKLCLVYVYFKGTKHKKLQRLMYTHHHKLEFHHRSLTGSSTCWCFHTCAGLVDRRGSHPGVRQYRPSSDRRRHTSARH